MVKLSVNSFYVLSIKLIYLFKFFYLRISLPWSGLRDDDLEKESNIPGAIFVHVNGFIGGAKTREGVLMIAIEALYQAGKI